MTPVGVPGPSGLYHPVVVRPEPAGGFTAVSVGAPEIHAEAATAQEAVERVRAELANWPGA
jgi:hypothetical protein